MYCSNCGNKMREAELYCPECGTPRDLHIHDVSEVIPMESSMEKIEREEIPKIKTFSKSMKGLKSFRKVSIVLLIVIAISATIKLIPFGGGLMNGKTGDSKTLLVSYDEPKVSLVGIDVDVNPLNLAEGDKNLTVEKMDEKIGEDGFLGIEYDISLDDQHYLRAPLSITIPFDSKAAEDSYVTVLHYDQDYEEWIPLNAEVNLEEHTVTAKLTSLSPIRLAYFDKEYSGSLYYIENKGSIHAKMKVSYNYWDYIKNTSMEPAKIVAKDYIATGNTVSSTDQMIKSGDAAISSVNTYYGLLGAFGDTILSSVALFAPAGSALEKVTGIASKDIGIVSLMIAGAQLMYDLGTKDSMGPRNETAVNLYKNIASNSGTLYSFCTGYSSAAFTASFFAVAVTGFVLDTLIEEAKTIQADTVETIFTTYYKDYSSFNEKTWYNLFVDAYWEAWQNNRGSEEGMNYAIKKVTDAINAHAEKFWTDIYKDGSDALTFAIAEAGQKNYFTPTADQKAELTANFKRDLFTRFNEKTMPWINEFMQERMTEAVYGSLLKAIEPYNKYYSLQIQEMAPQDGGESCKYQNCPIRFAGSEGFISSAFPEEWETIAPEDDDEWAVAKDFTLMGYLMVGAPDRVLFFDPSEEKILFGKQIREEKLVLSGEDKEYLTLIDLSVVGSNLSGEYVLNGESFRGIQVIQSNGELVDQSRSKAELNNIKAYVKHEGKDMEIKLNNDFGTVLIGDYDEQTQTFAGRDSEGNFLYSTEDTIVKFEVASNPIKATGNLDVEKINEGLGKVNIFILDFTMTRISD
ncbi:MAG: zinc ribbon domain-containing protein [Clostridium sp.]|nr:zinc ribbon domain-containing protein [Clostridium sp.]